MRDGSLPWTTTTVNVVVRLGSYSSMSLSARSQPMGNSGCHHDGVVCTSMRSTHLTHQ
jgi:hypothetical protein